jgi:hypothetical protein
MSLRDYVVTRDKFQLHDKGTVGLELSFPCCHCQHRNMRDTDEPCRTCDHNVNAVKDTANGVVGGMVTCRGCAGQLDDNECRHPNIDKRSCWHAKNPLDSIARNG